MIGFGCETRGSTLPEDEGERMGEKESKKDRKEDKKNDGHEKRV